MRIRYAYKLTDAEGNVTFKVLNHIKSTEEVKEMTGASEVEFHDRVRTGFRLNENGELVETGLVSKVSDAPALAPAASEPATEVKAPKAKKSSKKASK